MTSLASKQMHKVSLERGFTLIELLIVIGIIAVIAAIALPSYNRYIIKNEESQVKSSMGNLQLELERWRASALTYRGFEPTNSKEDDGYGYDASFDDPFDTVIYVPRGSDSESFRYKISLYDGTDNLTSLKSSGVATGSSWVMVATPNTNDELLSRASNFVLRSDGFKCKNVNGKGVNVNEFTKQCQDVGQETW